jgi:hypothetical protein
VNFSHIPKFKILGCDIGPLTNWVLALRGVRTRVGRVLLSLFRAPTTTKRRKQSNPSKLTTHPIQSHPLTPKRGAKKETLKLREEAFVCMCCGRAGHLDEFCFHRKRMEKRCEERNPQAERGSFCLYILWPCWSLG